MTGATRWTANAIVGWRPIFTFTRRRLEVLDWIEANAKPLAFTDTPEHTGVAIGRRDQRLRFDRSSLRLTLGSPLAGVGALTPTLKSIWAALDPEQASMTFYRAAWSIPLDVEYEDTRLRLTRRALGDGTLGEGLSAYDFATLFNFRAEGMDGSFEFGIVTGDELHARLSDPKMGLLRHGVPPAGAREVVSAHVDDLPAVSMFADVAVSMAVPLASAEAILGAVSRAEAVVAQLVTDVRSAL